MADANQALSVNPNDAAAYVCRGMANRLSGKFQDAIADLDRSIALNDKDYMAYSERGQAYMGLNQNDKAVVDFDRSLVLNPVNDNARASRGLVLLLKGKQRGGPRRRQERARPQSQQPGRRARPGPGDATLRPI